jgi:small conductance mechanosensitive channel
MHFFSRMFDHIPQWGAAFGDWLVTSGLRAVLVCLLAYILLRALRKGVVRFERYLAHAQDPAALEHAKRARTLGDLLHNVASVLIVVVAALMVLQELKVNIMPILTGAGILGLAVGFGAQTLVKDVISGFFLILENQVRVGDVAKINGTGGLVEAINLRTIVLRDQAGAVHVFPCGGVNTLANLSKDFAYALLDIQVAYKHDTDVVVAVMNEVSEQMRTSSTLGAVMLEPLEVIGVEGFGESSVTIRVRMKTLPLKQWDVAREFRRRLKKAFDAAGIEIPFPQRDITVRHINVAVPPANVQ